MKPLIDGDILRYELGFATETGWAAITEGEEQIPPWDYVVMNLHQRIDNICALVGATEPPTIYLTEGRTFRDHIATVKPYKGTRSGNKPWHYKNLSVYLTDVMDAKIVESMEADDMMAIDQVNSDTPTIICSRDKDLKQVPGWFYSWELGRQPQFGPEIIEIDGYLEMDGNKLSGTGLSFFYAQCLMGDTVDNIPGLPKCGAVGAFKALADQPTDIQLQTVRDLYQEKYGDEGDERLLEQGRLLWMTRRLHDDGSPVLWEIGMKE